MKKVVYPPYALNALDLEGELGLYIFLNNQILNLTYEVESMSVD